MEDLIPFFIFILIALVNFIKHVATKRSKEGQQTEPAGEDAPQQKPSTIEDFFENLAAQFEPKPAEPPAWPQRVERPDYVAEMEMFESPEPVIAEAQTPIVPFPEPAPHAAQHMEEARTEAAIQRMEEASLLSALKSIPALPSYSRTMLISTPSILQSSAAGQNHFPLKEKSTLRNALLANFIFSQPRAYETDFDNAVIR